MKLAGVIGGMGPGTTADFYRDINRLAEEQGREVRPELLVWNIPLRYSIEQRLLREQKGLEEYLPLIIHGAQKLERAGADFLTIPCNTVHELYPRFKDSVDIPFLHIVETTAQRLKDTGVTETELLATGETVGSCLYQKVLGNAGITCLTPELDDQKRLDTIVADLVTADGSARGGEREARDWINNLVDTYEQRVGTVVLGCTDFHIMLGERNPATVLDSMGILAEATTQAIYE